MYLLAGDIGGTKVSLAVFSSEAGLRRPLAEATLRTGDYPSLETLISEYLAQLAIHIDRACFGVAGPVIDGRVKVTNIPWVVDRVALQQHLALSSVYLLNDLEAVAYAVPHLLPDDLYTLHAGQPDPTGPKAIIAPGTGLGEGFLIWDGTHYRPLASEGGHTDFAPTNALQIELLRYLHERMDHVAYERVCSGLGLPNIYAFLKDSCYAQESTWLAEQLVNALDPTPLIVAAALDQQQPCPLCRAALDMFVDILGAEAGNLALKVMATGGVYLAGGIAPRILPALQDGRLLRAFRAKGRLSDLLTNIPVHVILNPHVALLGAACYGLQL